jgi:hypothetical protein
MTSRHILWDLDGTLAYREGMWVGTLIESLEAEAEGRRMASLGLRSVRESRWGRNAPWE